MVMTQAGLSGIRVLDLGRYQAGPRSALLFRDLGAEVIKVEPPGGEEGRKAGPYYKGQSIYWAMYNRGKKSITLNLRTDEGRDILRGLIRQSDILVENFRPGVMDKMEFGWSELQKLNRALIMVSVSGYGDDSPYRDRPAYDPVGQAMSGLMSLTGFPDTPPTLTYASIIDRITALHATIGALAALHHRERYGVGQRVEVSLLDSGISIMEIPLAAAYLTGVEPKRQGNRPGGSSVAPADTYRAKDGWVYLVVLGDSIWARFCEALKLKDLTSDPRFATNKARVEHREELDTHITPWVERFSVDEVVAKLAAAGVPAFPVRTVPEVLKDEHLWKRELLVPLADPVAGKMLVPGFAIRLSAVPRELGPIPRPGEHNAEIFGRVLGVDAAQLKEWESEGVI